MPRTSGVMRIIRELLQKLVKQQKKIKRLKWVEFLLERTIPLIFNLYYFMKIYSKNVGTNFVSFFEIFSYRKCQCTPQ